MGGRKKLLGDESDIPPTRCGLNAFCLILFFCAIHGYIPVTAGFDTQLVGSFLEGAYRYLGVTLTMGGLNFLSEGNDTDEPQSSENEEWMETSKSTFDCMLLMGRYVISPTSPRRQKSLSPVALVKSPLLIIYVANSLTGLLGARFRPKV